ncbi:nitrate- and nitrite sensing domain-containing protein [Microbispora sp. RL4-1S]|uniref:histidine kinase n=1 Tax=Microbispora oryzae TaxID=2806554 RepID=A0A940WLR0_9ACTN|nr:nitrate- and nitrite sensing domain-containing protein [Microbispora oryzae]MBP2705288.1 nitrate- and nitrite sensing domain-containing protein [Microbispora oryzae]
MRQSTTDNRRRGSRLSPRRWRVPTRLTALIVAPTLVAVLLAGVRVVGSIDSLNGYQRTRSAAEYSLHLRDLAQQLGLERDLAVWSAGNRTRKFNIDGQTEITRAQQRAVVDPLVEQVRADLANIDLAFGARAVEQAQQAASRLDSLKNNRVNGAPENYNFIIANLLRLHDDLSENDDDAQIVGNEQALSGIAHAKEEVSLQRAMLSRELLERHQTFTTVELQDFLASQSRQQGYLATFYSEAPSSESTRLVTLLGDKDVVTSELTKSWAITLGLRNQSMSTYRGRDVTLQRWFQESTKTITQMHTVEQRVSAVVLARARDLQSAEQRNALIAGGLILALLLLVLATTVLIARSMVTPLRRLRAEALDIAGRRLPDTVRSMRESDDTGNAPQVEPIAVGTEDEIGEVAQAFDEVHAQAVRLAAEESRLRANVNAMFVNLSRRTQTLVERQISLIDGLERGEEDGNRLSDLFKLDHLATRMRRNSENLLVLAGHEAPRKRSQPARLVDVVRASLSEVEDYERVVVRVHRNIALAGHAANDVVHLLAELVENAIAFSPRNTKVVVSSSPVEGGAVMLGVTDAGIGMSPEEMAEINRRLAEPPTIDVSVSRRMGLFVVGRLALRHGIRVQLRRGDGAGVIAMVLFPAQLVSSADQAAAPGQPAVPEQVVAAAQPAGGPPVRQAFGDPGPGGPAGGFEPWAAGRGRGGLPVRRPAAPAEDGPFGPVPAQPGLSGTTPADRHGDGETPPGAFGPFTPFGASPAQPSQPPQPASPLSAPAPGGLDQFGQFGQLGQPSGPHAMPGQGAVSPGVPAFGEPSGPHTLPGRGAPSPGVPAFGEPSGPHAMPGPFGEPSGTDDQPEEPPLFGRRPGRAAAAFTEHSGAFTEHSGAFTVADAGSVTGPLPKIDDSPLEQGDEFLPIFASVESAWFRRPVPGEAVVPPRPDGAPPSAPPSAQAPSGPPSAQAPRRPASAPTADGGGAGQGGAGQGGAGQGGPEGGWRSQADTGFQAAASARDPQLGGVTSAGLPKRTPKANLVPGSVGAPGPAAAPPRPPMSADAVRNRLSSFQQGVRRGRAEAADGLTQGSGNEEESS